jgi:hypothetical protein
LPLRYRGVFCAASDTRETPEAHGQAGAVLVRRRGAPGAGRAARRGILAGNDPGRARRRRPLLYRERAQGARNEACPATSKNCSSR